MFVFCKKEIPTERKSLDLERKSAQNKKDVWKQREGKFRKLGMEREH